MPEDSYLETVIDSQPRNVPLTPGVVCHIGRSTQNSVTLLDNQVSRRHAMIECVEGQYYLTDLGSRNGTFVNQKRVTAPVALRPGDRIGIGAHELVFRGPSKSAERPTAQGETVVDFSQRLITVLVTDIRDYTGLSQRLGEARLSQLMSAFFGECGAILEAHGAWAQKYIGDGTMAIWLHQNDPPAPRELGQVFASLAGLFDMAAGLHGRFGLDQPVRIGAGVNTGLASIGNVGSGAASDYTAMSDAVNLSFRLESATKEIGCDLAIGRKTHQFLSAAPAVASLFQAHTVKLKGYELPATVYGARRESLAEVVAALTPVLDPEATFSRTQS